MERKQVIYITRHGHRLDWANPNWIEQTNNKYHPKDTPLSDDGHKQAEILSQIISQDKKITHIFSSPFNRTIKTSHPIAEKLNLKIYVDHGISEWLPVESNTEKLFSDEYFLSFSDRYCKEYKSTIPAIIGVEKSSDLHNRCWNFVKRVEAEFTDKGNMVFVCHAASHIALVRAFLRDKTRDVFPGTCCLTKLVRNGDKWDVEVLCDDSHFDEHYRSPNMYLPWRFPEKDQLEINQNVNYS